MWVGMTHPTSPSTLVVCCTTPTHQIGLGVPAACKLCGCNRQWARHDGSRNDDSLGQTTCVLYIAKQQKQHSFRWVQHHHHVKHLGDEECAAREKRATDPSHTPCYETSHPALCASQQPGNPKLHDSAQRARVARMWMCVNVAPICRPRSGGGPPDATQQHTWWARASWLLVLHTAPSVEP